MKQYYRSEHHRILGGVLAGLGSTLGIHPGWLRALFLLLLLFPPAYPLLPFLVLGYLAAWLLAPVAPPDLDLPSGSALPGIYRSKDDRILAGVAGGLAQSLGVEANLVRVGFVVLAFMGGVGAVLYLALYLLMAEAS